MTVSRARFRWAAALAAATVLAQAAPAAAQAPPPAPAEPVGSYLLTVAPETGPAGTKTLRCGPDGGTLSAASRACAQLAAADGHVARIPPRKGACTMEHAPVRVSADGTWRGQPRHFTRTYSNRCTATRATGGVLFAG